MDEIYKDSKSTITTGFETISITFLVAFSWKHFYGIMSNESTNDLLVFRYFMSKVCEARLNLFNKFDSKFWCIIDNASIHKSSQIKIYTKQNNSSSITISTYSPLLNAVESIIQSIKAKIKSFR